MRLGVPGARARGLKRRGEPPNGRSYGPAGRRRERMRASGPHARTRARDPEPRIPPRGEDPRAAHTLHGAARAPPTKSPPNGNATGRLSVVERRKLEVAHQLVPQIHYGPRDVGRSLAVEPCVDGAESGGLAVIRPSDFCAAALVDGREERLFGFLAVLAAVASDVREQVHGCVVVEAD